MPSMNRLDTKRRPRRLPHLLKPRGRAALNELASGRVLVAFDFDGTLAPIADRPEGARMTGRTRRLLARVARLYPCAIISGRPRRDLLRRLRRIPVVAVAGSHGAEVQGAAGTRPRSLVRSWARRLGQALGRRPGVALEIKPHGVAVHYRRAEDKRTVRQLVLSLVATLDDARHISGKDVVEVVRAAAPNKGHALAALRRRLKPRVTLYVGDDVTDEDAFSCGGPGGLLAVRVGMAKPTRALFRLDDQAEVESLLHVLIRLAPRSVRRAAPPRPA
jgi:trehalose 6-phosphate phosphatase